MVVAGVIYCPWLGDMISMIATHPMKNIELESMVA